MRTAVDLGVNFFNSADVYGMDRSERLIAKLKKECSKRSYIAIKTVSCAPLHIAESDTPINTKSFYD